MIVCIERLPVLNYCLVVVSKGMGKENMFHHIAPHRFSNAFAPALARAQDYVLHYSAKGEILLLAREGDYALPRLCDVAPETLGQLQYLFEMDGQGCYLSAGETALRVPGGGYYPVNLLRSNLNRDTAYAGVVGAQLSRWYGDNRFCGRCGAAMAPSQGERALICTGCGKTVYPKISPAVITAIIDGDRILLARGAHYGAKFFSLIAGYVEIGETLEQAVARETMEEVGVRVKNIRYYANQPWPFSDSQMIGFFAQLDGDPTLHIDPAEIAEAAWFERETLPDHPYSISIAGEMMEAYKRGKVYYRGGDLIVD